jgi:tetratricopeptide (TPR) repeat protein
MTLAREAGHPRAELLGYILRTWTQYYMGDFELAMEDCLKAEESAHRLGARRFEGQNHYYHALCLYKLGRQGEALPLLDTAENLSRQFSPRFTLARVLSGIALVTDDPGRRESALCEGERLLDEGSVSHNYFSFYTVAAEACFDHREWGRMEHYADRLEAYSAAEPLPWSDFVIERNRKLAQWGRGDRSPEVMESLRKLLELANEARLLTPAAQIETVLAGDADQRQGQSS